MRVTHVDVLTTDPAHPIYAGLVNWVANQSEAGVKSRLLTSSSALRDNREKDGNISLLFLIACHEIVSAEERVFYDRVFVVHASDLPKGRGWSPAVWQILEGIRDLPLCLIEAEDQLDSGAIWLKSCVRVPESAVASEINALLSDATLSLMDRVMRDFHTLRPVPQDSAIQPSYYSKRTPDDSRLDPGKTISEQFELLRVCDPDRYPAFVEARGRVFDVILRPRTGDDGSKAE